MGRYAPTEYKPDGGFSAVGLPVLLFVMVVAAAAVGWLTSFISQWFYLVFLFPMAMGLALTGVGYFVGRLTKLRNVGLGLVVGLIAGTVCVVVMHYSDFLRFRGRLAGIPDLPANARPAGPDAMKLILALQAAQKLKGVDSFLGYMNQQATEGVTIGRRGGGVNLGFTGSWIYWGLELLVVAVVTTLGLAGGAAAPFCTTCDRWKEQRKLGTLDGDPAAVKRLLEEGDLQTLRSLPLDGELHVTVHVCPACGEGGDIAVKLDRVTKNDKGEEATSELVQLTYPGTALAELEAAFADRPDEEDEILDVQPVDPKPTPRRRPTDEEDNDRPRRTR